MTPPATSSGLVTTSSVISAGPGRLRGAILVGDGVNAPSVVIYDNASAGTGLVLCKLSGKAGDTNLQLQIADEGIVANNGVYAVLTGTGANCIIYYDRG